MAEAYALTTETAAGTELGSGTAADVELASDDYAGWYAALTAAQGEVYAGSASVSPTPCGRRRMGFHLAGFVSNATPAFGGGGYAGLRLVTSQGLVGNAVLVGDSQSLLVAETPGAPVEMRAVEPSIGGMELGVIGAFVAELTDPLAVVGIINAVPLGAGAQARSDEATQRAEQLERDRQQAQADAEAATEQPSRASVATAATAASRAPTASGTVPEAGRARYERGTATCARY